MNESNLTHSYLKGKLNINARTLNNTILYGNDILKPLKIIKSLKGGVKLYIPDTCSIEFAYQKILCNSMEFRVLECIFFDETYTIETLSEKLFVSTATLRRMIKKINDCLITEDFRIAVNPIRIEGKEERICNFIVHYFLEKSSDEYVLFKKNQLSLVDYMIQTTLKKKNFELTYENLRKIRIWLLVVFNRSKIKQLNTQDFGKKSNPKIAENIFEKFNNYKSLTIQKNPYFFLLNQIFLNKLTYTTKHKLVTQKIYDTQVLSNLRMFDGIITSIVKRLKIDAPKNKEEVLMELCYIANIQYGRSYCIYNKHYIFYQKLANYTLGITDELYEIFYLNMSNRGILVQDYQIYCYIYTMIVYWQGFIPSIKRRLPKIRIGLYFSVDPRYMIVLKDILSSELSEESILTLISEEVFEEKHYDLILTNKQNLEKHSHCLCFPIFPNSKNIEVLREYIKKLQKEIINN